MNKKTCTDCRWWESTKKEDREGLLGKCRRSLPIYQGLSHHGEWPLTYSYDWCGYHQVEQPNYK